MTISILNDCLKLKSEPLQSFIDYFKSINVNTFNPIFDSEKNENEKKQTILFILIAYSEDSPMVVLRQGSKEEKENICEYLDLPEYMRNNLIALQDSKVRKVATDYLYQFAGEMFRNLMFMKIQSEYFDLVITNRDFLIPNEGAPPNYDIKEHGKAIAEKARLAKEIIKTENELKVHTRKLEAIDTVKEWKDKNKGKQKGLTREMNIESSPQIR